MIAEHKQDYDLCQVCYERPAHYGAPWDIDYCSKSCAMIDLERREDESDRERSAEITSGGQS